MFSIPGNPNMQTPFTEMDFWKWAEKQLRGNVRMSKYLGHLGFVVGVDQLTEDQYSILKGAVQHFHDTAPHMGSEVFSFDDLFHPCDSPGAYFVRGKAGKYRPVQKVIDALNTAGWIESINPHTTYFEIVRGNKLWAKYQTILGSRPLAHIKE